MDFVFFIREQFFNPISYQLVAYYRDDLLITFKIRYR